MRTPPNIADRASLDRNRSRMTATFMLDAVADEIQERLIEVNRPFNAPAIVSGQPEYWATHFPDAV
ncbi:MAG: SAM-dependent methyltransferase, partial [Marivivens sp.]|nr:SAM-dependent methyltransferase [Marivivens sp.]